jgi:metal-responsive CopG/Arc/MetJ family transcriptional regulator
MDPNSNDVESDATSLRSSILFPAWMNRQLQEIAARTFSSRSQVIRRFVAEGLERESAASAEAMSR